MNLGVTIAADPTYNTVVYEASGAQLYWLDENKNGESVFLGSLQQQGSLTGLPATHTPAKAKSKHKR
jgi:hypothetical protein